MTRFRLAAVSLSLLSSLVMAAPAAPGNLGSVGAAQDAPQHVLQHAAMQVPGDLAPRIQPACHRRVRDAAIELLARFWPDDPDTLALLRERGLQRHPGAELKSPWPGHLDLGETAQPDHSLAVSDPGHRALVHKVFCQRSRIVNSDCAGENGAWDHLRSLVSRTPWSRMAVVSFRA